MVFTDSCQRLLSRCAQATLGVLYAQPPLTQDANVATDGNMMTGVVEPVPDGKKVEETIEGLPSPGGSANASVDVSVNDAHVAARVEPTGVNGVVDEILLAPSPVLVSIDDQQQQQGKAGDLPGVTEVPEVRVQVVFFNTETA